MGEEIDDTQVLSRLLAALRPLSQESRKRLVQTVATFYDLGRLAGPDALDQPSVGRQPLPSGGFSEDRSESPKEFLHEKNPESETERLVCLAYYLTHYRGTPHFKTLDLTQLNTEAAQIKFSNASATVHSASMQGLVGPAPNGNKQITTRGERFVSLLPDRTAARAVITEKRSSRRHRRNSNATEQAKIE